MKKPRLYSWLPVILWMGLIYYLSAQTGEDSSILSSNLTVRIIAFTRLGVSEDIFNSVLRTFAHFSLYFVLGILIINSLQNYNYRLNDIFITIFIGVVYAVSDEIHQYFVPGRAAQIFDIMIDFIGILFGIIVYKIIIIRSKILKI